MLNIKADTNKITDQVRPIMEIVPTAMSAMQRAPYALTGVQRVAMYTAHCEPLCMRKMNHRGLWITLVNTTKLIIFKFNFHRSTLCLVRHKRMNLSLAEVPYV